MNSLHSLHSSYSKELRHFFLLWNLPSLFCQSHIFDRFIPSTKLCKLQERTDFVDINIPTQ